MKMNRRKSAALLLMSCLLLQLGVMGCGAPGRDCAAGNGRTGGK